MKKYKVNAIRTDEYEIEIDENIWTEEALEAWNSVFGGCDNLEELAKHLSFSLLRFGYERFLEGFGYVYTVNKKGEKLSQYERDNDGNWIIVSDFANGIKVKIIREDDDYDFEIDELLDCSSPIQHISCDKPLSPQTSDLIVKIVDEAYETK